MGTEVWEITVVLAWPDDEEYVRYIANKLLKTSEVVKVKAKNVVLEK